MLQKPIDVDHGNRQKCSPDRSQSLQLHQPSNDLRPDDLVTVNGAADKQAGALTPPVHHMDRHGHFGVGVEAGNRYRNSGLLARFDPGAGDGDGRLHHPRPLVRVLPGAAFFSI